MFDILKRHFSSPGGRDASSRFAVDDPRLAVAALMVHVVAADGVVTAQERRRLEEELTRRYALNADTSVNYLVATRKTDTA